MGYNFTEADQKHMTKQLQIFISGISIVLFSQTLCGQGFDYQVVLEKIDSTAFHIRLDSVKDRLHLRNRSGFVAMYYVRQTRGIDQIHERWGWVDIATGVSVDTVFSKPTVRDRFAAIPVYVDSIEMSVRRRTTPPAIHNILLKAYSNTDYLIQSNLFNGMRVEPSSEFVYLSIRNNSKPIFHLVKYGPAMTDYKKMRRMVTPREIGDVVKWILDPAN